MKNRLTIAGAAVALACICAPAAAQEGDISEEAMAEAAIDMGGFVGNEVVFEVEPLTPEQEARMPAATRLVDLAIPEGAYSEAIGGVFGGLFGAADSITEPNAINGLTQALGYAYYNDDLAPSKAERALAILDPSWRERQEIENGAMQEYMGQMMTAMEPAMRQALAELYAIRFTEEQLADIASFYETETGQVFARESMSMSSDPRIYNALMTSSFFTGEYSEPDFSAMQDALEALPTRPAYADLSERDRALVAALLGIEEFELEAMMTGAAMEAGQYMEIMEAVDEAEAIMAEED